MNAKKLSFLLLILVAVACTNRSTSSEQDEMRHWNNVLQQINALLLENKARQTLDLAKQTLPDRKSTRLNSSHTLASRMPSSA